MALQPGKTPTHHMVLCPCPVLPACAAGALSPRKEKLSTYSAPDPPAGPGGTAVIGETVWVSHGTNRDLQVGSNLGSQERHRRPNLAWGSERASWRRLS